MKEEQAMPFETWEQIAAASLEERLPILKDLLRAAVRRVLVEDTDLIALGAHEQAVTHRVAMYLEQLLPKRPDLDANGLSSGRMSVDAEYNRSGEQPKGFVPSTQKIPKKFRPDVVLHSRLTPDFNYLAIEAKPIGSSTKWRELRDEDEAKIEHLVTSGRYCYNLGALLTIYNKKSHFRKCKLAVITIQWFTRAEKWSTVEPISQGMSPVLLKVARRRTR